MRKIVTIDGPSGVGKGTICQRLAQTHDLAYLDSGALYRLSALFVQAAGLTAAGEAEQAALLAQMKVHFEVQPDGVAAFLDGQAVGSELRLESTGQLASQLAAKPAIRAALLDFQRQFAADKDLVADGRDMGTVVFPEAALKIVLEASVEARANRRYKQLIAKGESVTLAALKNEIAERDARDRNREVAPYVPAADAVLIDTTDLSVDAVFEQVNTLFQARFF